MGVGWLGFAAGASTAALDSITAREKAKKEEDLIRLRDKLAAEQADIQHKRDIEKDDLQEGRVRSRPKDPIYNPDTKSMDIFDSMGKKVGSRAATRAENEAHVFESTKNNLSLDVQRANIRQSDASVASSYADVDYKRKAGNALGKSGSGAGGGSTKEKLGEITRELIYQNKGNFGDLSPSVVNAAISDIVKRRASQALLGVDGGTTLQDDVNTILTTLNARAKADKGRKGKGEGVYYRKPAEPR